MLVGVRPLQPPIHDQIAEEYDKFHPVVTSPTPVSLPPATLAAFSDARARIKADQESHPEPQKPGDDVVILPLGTSSALPSKYRNGKSNFRFRMHADKINKPFA